MRRVFRFSAIAFTLSLVSASFAQSLDQKVTFQTKASGAGQVLQALAEKTGVQVEASPAVAREIILVSVKEMALQRLLDEVANVTVGAWQKEGDVLRLVPDVGKRRGQAVSIEKAELETIQNGLAGLAKALEPKKPGEEKNDDTEAMFGQMFGMGGGAGLRVIARLALGLSPQVLATIPSGERIVFSSNPTRMQRPLPNSGAANADVAAWIDERNKAAANAGNQGLPPGLGEISQEELELLGSFMGDMFQRPKKITSQPAKLILVASKGGGFMRMFGLGGGVNLKVVIYDTEGNAILQQEHSLEANMFDGMPEMPEPEGEGEGEAPPTEEPKETPIKFSEISTAMQKIFNISDPRRITEGSIDPKFEDILIRPDVNEPLSFTASEAILAVAEHKKVDVVANIPDTAISFFSNFGGEPMTIEGFTAELADNESIVQDEKDGLWTLAPKNVEEAAKNRLDRKSLADLIVGARKKVVPSLDEVAAFAAANEDPMSNGLAMTYITAFAPSLMQQGFGMGVNWNMLRLYGQLGSGQRQLVRSGQPIAFGSLSPAQSETVRKMLFGTESNLQVISGEPKKPQLRMMDMMMGFARGRGGTSYKQEPTEIMPNGLPPQGQIQVQVTETQFAIQVTKDNRPTPMIGAIGAEELALLRFFSEDARMAAMMSEAPEFNRLRVGNRVMMDFTFVVAPDVVAKHSLIDDSEPGTQLYTMQNLPEKLNAEVEAKKQLVKDSPLVRMMAFGMSQGMGGGRPPVPPQ